MSFQITYVGAGSNDDPNFVESNGIKFKLNVKTPVESKPLALMLSRNHHFIVDGLDPADMPAPGAAPSAPQPVAPVADDPASVLARRAADLDARSSVLDQREEDLDDRIGALAEAERDLASRQQALADRERAVASIEASLSAPKPTQAEVRPPATAKAGPLPGLGGGPVKKS